MNNHSKKRLKLKGNCFQVTYEDTVDVNYVNRLRKAEQMMVDIKQSNMKYRKFEPNITCLEFVRLNDPLDMITGTVVDPPQQKTMASCFDRMKKQMIPKLKAHMKGASAQFDEGKRESTPAKSVSGKKRGAKTLKKSKSSENWTVTKNEALKKSGGSG